MPKTAPLPSLEFVLVDTTSAQNGRWIKVEMPIHMIARTKWEHGSERLTTREAYMAWLMSEVAALGEKALGVDRHFIAISIHGGQSFRGDDPHGFAHFYAHG